VSENIILGSPASLPQQLKPSNSSWLSNDEYQMAGLVRETRFGSSIFGCDLGKGDVLIHHVNLMVATQIVGESSRCNDVLF